jgi:hypothetical protein
MSSRKEPCFWSPDVVRPGRVVRHDDYRALWSGAAEGALRGEASTAYLESRVAIPAILAARSDARLIAMVRCPWQLARARHSDLLRRFQEDVGDFETAWHLQDARRRGKHIPPQCREPQILQYQQIALIGDMIERFVAAVPEEQRLILLLDDLEADAAGVYRLVLAFLGLADDGRSDFAVVNPNCNLRSPRLARLHRSLPRLLGPLYAPLRAASQRLGLSPSAVVNRINLRPGPRPALRPEFEAELVETFRPQVEKLEPLLGRDLSHWKRATGCEPA